MPKTSKMLTLLALLLFPVFSATAKPVIGEEIRGASNIGFGFEEWRSGNAGGRMVAGIRADTPGLRVLAVSPQCDAQLDEQYTMAFSVELGSIYSIFMQTQFLPGMAQSAVSATAQVDQGSPLLLQDIAASWNRGVLTVDGTIGGLSTREAMEQGLSLVFNVHFKSSVLITQTFSLRGSSRAFEQISCP